MTPEPTAKPLILLVFANDHAPGGRYLRNVPEERRQLVDLLRPLQARELFDLEVLPNATVDELATALLRCAGRIAVIHYGGHASGNLWQLETTKGEASAADATGLAGLLGQQPGLKLVFLNGCGTEPQVEALLAQGIPAAVATATAVSDEVALSFAASFYAALAKGSSIESAYRHAADAGRTRYGMPGKTYRGARPASSVAADRWPWSLRIRDGADDVKNWNLPQAAGDFLFGLPELPIFPLPERPYHEALNWYTCEQAELFYGRGRQIRDLFQRLSVKDSSPVVLLYGQSGVGKSSLLDAGLLPRLDQVCSVKYLRRDRALGARATLCAALGVDPEAGDAALLAAWHTRETTDNRPFVILLDQIEEVFTRPLVDQPQELAELVSTIAATFNRPATRPQGHLLLSFRKEFLPDIEQPLTKLAVDRSYVYVERLDHDSIVEVVRGPTRSTRLRTKYNLTVEDDLPEVIAQDLTSDPASPVATVLHILLTEMWQAAEQRSKSAPYFDLELYNQLRRRGILLQDFFTQRVQEFQRVQDEVVTSGLLFDLLAFHTSPQGAAEERSAAQLTGEYRHRQDLPEVIGTAKELRLLSDPAGESGDTERASGARLAHDTLAPIVRQAFAESSRPGQRARRVLESRLALWTGAHADANGDARASDDFVLDAIDLALVEQGVGGMRALTADEETLVAASKTKRDAEHKRARMWRILGALAVGAIILLAVTSLLFSLSARAQQAIAESNAATAKQSAIAAQEQANLASLRETEREGQLALSQSREVAAVAENRQSAGDAQTALQLSIIAFAGITETEQAETALRASLNAWHGIKKLAGHAAPVTGLYFSKDGRYLASAATDNTARIWDVATGETLFVVDAHEGDVTAAIFSGDSRHLVTSSRDGTVRIWKTSDGTLEGTLTFENILDGIRSMAIHADGKRIALRAGAEIWLYDIETRQPSANSPYVVPDVPTDQAVALRSLAFTADGLQILAGGDDLLPHIWNIETGQHASFAPTDGGPGHVGPVTGFQQSIDGQFLASLSTDLLLIWKANETGNGVETYRLPQSADGIRFTGHLTFSPDSRYLAVGSENGVVRIWTLANLIGNPVQINEHAAALTGIWFSPDSRLLASADQEGTVRLWNMISRVGTPVVYTQRGNGTAPMFSRDGRVLATADELGNIYLWRVWLGGNATFYHTHAHAAQALTVAEDQLIIVGSNGIVEFRNRRDGTLFTHPFRDTYFTAAATASDHQHVALGDMAGRVTLLDGISGAIKDYWRADSSGINDLLFLPDAESLVVAGAGGALQLWNWQTLQLQRTLEGPINAVSRLAYSAAQKRLYAADRSGTIHVWQLPAFTPLEPLRASAAIVSLAVSADGEQVAAGDTASRLIWWSAGNSGTPRTIAAGTVVRAMAFAPDGRLVAGGENGELQIWDLPRRAVVPIAAHGERWIKDLWLDEEANTVTTVGDDGVVKTWLLDDKALLALACGLVGTQMDEADWAQMFDLGSAVDLAPCASTGAALTQPPMSLSPPAPDPIGKDEDALPAVLYLESTKGARVPAGESTTIRWAVEGAEVVNLEYQGRDNPVLGKSETTVRVTQPMTFRLVARNWAGKRVVELKVTPN